MRKRGVVRAAVVIAVIALIAVVAPTYYFLTVREGIDVEGVVLKSTDVPPEF